MDKDLVELAVRALADTRAERAHSDADAPQLLELVEHAAVGLRGGGIEVAPEEIPTLVDAILARPNLSSGFEYTRRQVARWFEVPPDEFDQTPMEQLEAEVLFRHIHYENLFAAWFREWGYEVDVGEELEGIGGADFIPDVYATLDTLHGSFQVAITFFCDRPPNTYRVLGMLENIEAFAVKGSEFGQRDVYLLVTPFKFLEQASNHIRIQAEQEEYFVVAVEGNDLEDLERSKTAASRMERLQELILAAVGQTRRPEAS